MRSRLRRLIVSGAIAAALLLAPHSTRAVDTKTAPDVVVQDLHGATVRLGAYKGHVLLIDFWASWCPSCKAAFPALDALARQYEPQGVVILAVNVDERRRDADAFLNARPHTMTVLFDPKGDAPLAFGVRGMPSSFVIDRAGTIRFTHMGYSGNVADQYRDEISRLLSER